MLLDKAPGHPHIYSIILESHHAIQVMRYRITPFERTLTMPYLQIIVIFATLLVGLPLTSMAGNSDNTEMQTTPANQNALPMVAGEIRKVDASTGKITIKHEEIPNFGIPAMTMLFKAGDPAMLEQFKAGDKVRFAIDKVDGALTIVSLELVGQ
jgi:Cu/Ag efflux protein CusF